MLTPKEIPKRFRGYLRDPINALLLDSGSHHVVDDRAFRWKPRPDMIRGATISEILACGQAQVRAEGAFTVLAFEEVRLGVTQGLAKAHDEALVLAGPGTEAHLKMRARFESKHNACIHLYGPNVSGIADGDTTVYLHEGANPGNVDVRSPGVRFVDLRAAPTLQAA